MDLVRKKLERITDFWNDFVWSYKMIQNQIVWDEEVKTNYYGDILCYLNDTFDLLKRKPSKSDFQDSIFYVTGLLQIIYVQQDLTDELLRIFKIENSSRKDKNPNREIRNELIGHPISKEKVGKAYKFKSSIFWGRHLTTENLHYIKYAMDKNFEGEEKSYKIEDIITSHREYLDKYFDKISEKIRNVLKKYAKHLKELESALEKEIDFFKIVDLTSQTYEHMFELNYLYNVKCLKECYKRKDEHVRYQYVVDFFKKELSQCLIDTHSDIQRLISDIKLEKETTESIETPQIEIRFFDSSDNSILKNKKPRDYRYEIGKLHGKHPIYGVSYFKGLFKDNPKIIVELDNMEFNMHNDLEYYSSFEYLTYLIKKRKQ